MKKRDIKSYLFFFFFFFIIIIIIIILLLLQVKHTEKKQKLHGINKVIKTKNKNKTNSEFTHYFDISKYIAM